MLKFLGFLKDRQNQFAIYIIVISGLFTGGGYFIKFSQTLEANERAISQNIENCFEVNERISKNEHETEKLSIRFDLQEANAKEQKNNQKEMLKLLQELQINSKAVSTALEYIKEKH